MRIETYTPKHLGKQSSDPVENIDRIPWAGEDITVELACSEFTSYCPVTHQPDFGRLTIRYSPDKWLVETKSLKLYLTGFRDRGMFNEALVDRIAGDLFKQLEPAWIEVAGTFNSRGGISVNVTARRES